jgi:hypothetical protein
MWTEHYRAVFCCFHTHRTECKKKKKQKTKKKQMKLSTSVENTSSPCVHKYTASNILHD